MKSINPTKPLKRTLLTLMFVSLGSGAALADDRHRRHYDNGFQAFIKVGGGHYDAHHRGHRAHKHYRKHANKHYRKHSKHHRKPYYYDPYAYSYRSHKPYRNHRRHNQHYRRHHGYDGVNLLSGVLAAKLLEGDRHGPRAHRDRRDHREYRHERPRRMQSPGNSRGSGGKKGSRAHRDRR